MNDSLTTLENIQSGFKKMKIVTVGVLVAATVISAVSVCASIWFALSQRNQVYILDEGSVLSAFRSDNGAQRDLEVGDHLTRFLQLFFNVAPNSTTIESNIEKALNLADGSAYEYYKDLKEKQYYSRLITIGASQSIEVDSVVVDVFSYPYRAEAYGNLYTIRETNMSKTPFVSNCILTESQRTRNNVHGLLIERFHIDFGKQDVVRRR